MGRLGLDALSQHEKENYCNVFNPFFSVWLPLVGRLVNSHRLSNQDHWTLKPYRAKLLHFFRELDECHIKKGNITEVALQEAKHQSHCIWVQPEWEAWLCQLCIWSKSTGQMWVTEGHQTLNAKVQILAKGIVSKHMTTMKLSLTEAESSTDKQTEKAQ